MMASVLGMSYRAGLYVFVELLPPPSKVCLAAPAAAVIGGIIDAAPTHNYMGVEVVNP